MWGSQLYLCLSFYSLNKNKVKKIKWSKREKKLKIIIKKKTKFL